MTENVVEGPEPIEPIPSDCLGKIIYESLIHNDAKHEAMVDGFTGNTISYEKLLQDTSNLAEALRAYGCTANNTISVCSENNLQFFIPVIASLYIGSIVAPLNHIYTTGELKHTLNIAQPRIVFCSQFVAPKFVKLQQELSFLKEIIVIDATQRIPNVQTVQDFVSRQLRGRRVLSYEFQPFNGPSEEQVAFIMCSSGTTGLPKGVMLTHRNVATRIAQSRDARFYNTTDVSISVMPFFHCYGLNNGISNICNSTKMIVLKRFEEDIFLKTIQDYKVTALLLAPPLAIFLAKTPKLNKYDLSCVKTIRCGAAPLSKNVEAVLSTRFNVDSIKQGYGLTEANLAVTMFSADDKKTGSVGKVLTYMKLKVRDPESGTTLGPNQVGEICITGPSVMKGYYRNEEATRDTFTDGAWLRTGDLGYYDDEKYFYIVDRLKELIKYNGYQVAPAELEGIMLQHAKVMDVGVVGVPDDISGELPLAFVVKRPGVDVTEKELIDFVNGKVSSQKRLRGGVIFVPSIPKNSSGKILRRELRQQLKEVYIPIIMSKL